MAERNPYFAFGVTDVSLYQISDGVPLAHLRAVGDCGGDFTADTVKVEGGSQNFPWKVAITGFKGSIKLKLREYSPEALAIFLGGTSTVYPAAATGAVVDDANVKGTTLKSAAGFLSPTITAGDEADAKSGWYILKAASASTVDIYAYSTAHLNRGTDATVQDNYIKLTASPLAIPSGTGATLVVADLGLTFTRGASALAVTSGDTMRFFVQAPISEAWKLKFGQSVPSFNDVGVIIGGERDSGEGMMLHLYRCKCLGAPLNFVRKGYAEMDITVEPQYDSGFDGVGELMAIREA